MCHQTEDYKVYLWWIIVYWVQNGFQQSVQVFHEILGKKSELRMTNLQKCWNVLQVGEWREPDPVDQDRGCHCSDVSWSRGLPLWTRVLRCWWCARAARRGWVFRGHGSYPCLGRERVSWSLDSLNSHCFSHLVLKVLKIQTIKTYHLDTLFHSFEVVCLDFSICLGSCFFRAPEFDDRFLWF